MRNIIAIKISKLLLLLSLIPSAGISAGPDILKQDPIVLEKPNTMLSEKAREYLNNQTGEKVKIWVFYNDKGVFNSQDFDRAARKIEINDKAAQRRAKMGLNEVVFADLPVVQDYIDRITDIGGRMLRASRWLNAAAFEIDREKINLIPEFSFVNKIVPVAQYISPAPSEMEESPVPPEDLKISPTDTDALDYGTSYNQVQMINVPAMHNLGYNGSGVVVAMLDTGYRKSHNAFDSAFADNRVLAEYDFIFDDSETQNETEDNASQHNHGTYCWSTLGGYAPGYVIGPAYDASFLLAKTEDVRSETIVEEYNWVAGMEWADSLGADVISTSLGYSEWYSYEDFDGNTAVTTVAANTAAGLGIIICNSAGNEGPSAGTLSAPADAFDILACGAVDQYESIASFSSRGPTYDGRTKPEVCAMGVSTHCADGAGNNFYTIKNGTSLSTPLVGGAAALLLSANPTLTPWQVRAAFMETANNAASPDNTYGWGVINVLDAFNWGANFTIDTAFGWDDLTVNFTDSSTPPATSWKWHFGDGDSSEIQNPSHTYSTPGSYDVTLVIESSEGALTRLKKDLIVVLADTLTFAETAGFAGETAIMSVNLTNSQELNRIVLPVKYPASMEVILDSISAGTRTIDFEATNELYRDNDAHQLVYELIADNGGGTGELQPGTGEIARLFFAVGGTAEAGDYAGVNAIEINGYELDISNSRINYTPAVNAGQLVVQSTMRGDADNSGGINILDVTYIVNYLYRGGPAPLTIRAGDADSSGGINILDATYLIAYLYRGGPPPAE